MNCFFFFKDVNPFISKAFLRMHLLYDIPLNSLRLDNYSAKLLDLYPLPNSSSAGYHGVRVQVIQMTTRGCQDKVCSPPLTRKQMRDSLIHQMNDMYCKWKLDNNIDEWEFWPKMVHVVTQKTEPRLKGEKLYKVRNFSIPPALKMQWDCILMTQFHKNIYQKPGISIGHKWPGGGAHYLATYFEWDKKNEWFYLELDFSGLDYTMLANLIMLLHYEGVVYFDSKMEDLSFYKRVAQSSSINAAFKNQAWWSGSGNRALVRYIIGTLASGEFQTSTIDTRYVNIVFFLAFDDWVFYKLLQGKDMDVEYMGIKYVIPFSQFDAHSWKAQFDVIDTQGYSRKYVPREVYGDDVLTAWKNVFFFLCCVRRLMVEICQFCYSIFLSRCVIWSQSCQIPMFLVGMSVIFLF